MATDDGVSAGVRRNGLHDEAGITCSCMRSTALVLDRAPGGSAGPEALATLIRTDEGAARATQAVNTARLTDRQ